MENLQLIELSNEEMQIIDGGSVKGKVIAAVLRLVADLVEAYL